MSDSYSVLLLKLGYTVQNIPQGSFIVLLVLVELAIASTYLDPGAILRDSLAAAQLRDLCSSFVISLLQHKLLQCLEIPLLLYCTLVINLLRCSTVFQIIHLLLLSILFIPLFVSVRRFGALNSLVWGLEVSVLSESLQHGVVMQVWYRRLCQLFFVC